MPNKTQAGGDDSTAMRAGRGQEVDLDQLRNAVAGIRYGEVRVIIQDGVIVQIERVEKRRLR
jgi:hypothetical protein